MTSLRAFLERLHAIIDPIALRILKWMNALAGVLIAAVAAFSAMHPNFPAEAAAALHLTQTQALMLGFAWCGLVQYVLRRLAKTS